MKYLIRYVAIGLLCVSFGYNIYSQDIILSKGRSITHIAGESSYPYGVSVSDSGWILLASSEWVSVHSPNLTEVFGVSPENLFQRNNVFSLRCGYFPDKDLFIIAALVSNESRPTELALAYFKADSTTTSWNTYFYSSDLESNGCNLKNLNIGVYAQEMIITAEVIDTFGSVLKNAVLQMSLRNIEQAKPSYLNWKNLPTFFVGTPGVLCPVKSRSGPPYFIISNQELSFYQTFCYAISDTIGGAAEITGYTFTVPTYYEPVAFQPSGSPLLTSGSTYVRDAYIHDSTLFFTYSTQKDNFSISKVVKANLRNFQTEILNTQDSVERACFPTIAPIYQNGNIIGSVLSQKRYPEGGFGYSEAYGLGLVPTTPTVVQLKSSTDVPDSNDWGIVSQIVSSFTKDVSWALTSFHKNNKLQTTVIELISQTVSRLDQDFSPEVELFPNPAYRDFSIILSQKHQIAKSIRVYNILGEIIYNKKINHEPTLNVVVSDWLKGIYFVEIQFVNGDYARKKLVVH